MYWLAARALYYLIEAGQAGAAVSRLPVET